MTPIVRLFREDDFIGTKFLCPHCQQLLDVVKAEGPYVATNPELGQLDRAWVLTFTDGEQARFWEDHKGVVVPAERAS